MDDLTIWSKALPSPRLQPGEVHVWRLDLDQPSAELEKFRETLDALEIERSSRFHFAKLRQHFVVGRGFLREVLARYVRTDPGALRFSYGPHGKPSLDDPHSGLRFNMSHSHGVALVAVAENKELGVDVEHVRADFATEDIARRFFSRVEVEAFNTLAKEEQMAAFFRCWTRKEAYIKATGRGMSQPLDAFDVTLAPDERAALLRAEDDDASRWTFSDIDLGRDYAAALAVEGPSSTIRLWHL